MVLLRDVAINKMLQTAPLFCRSKEITIYKFILGYVRKVNEDALKMIPEFAYPKAIYMAYARRSTHFLDEQNNYRQYGIDIRFNERSHPQALLPVGKTHLLFGRINRELIYIKMEDYGVCWDSASTAWR